MALLRVILLLNRRDGAYTLAHRAGGHSKAMNDPHIVTAPHGPCAATLALDRRVGDDRSEGRRV